MTRRRSMDRATGRTRAAARGFTPKILLFTPQTCVPRNIRIFGTAKILIFLGTHVWGVIFWGGWQICRARYCGRDHSSLILAINQLFLADFWLIINQARIAQSKPKVLVGLAKKRSFLATGDKSWTTVA